jgi:hypothetical protein
MTAVYYTSAWMLPMPFRCLGLSATLLWLLGAGPVIGGRGHHDDARAGDT